MNTMTIALVLMGLVVAAVGEGMDVAMEGVEEVTDLSELDGWWVVAVYMKGCSYCEMLAPEWRALGVVVGEKYHGLHIGKADGEGFVVEGLSEGYPGIFIMSDEGVVVEFKEDDNRVLRRFLMFIEEHTPYSIDGSVRGMSEEIRSSLKRVFYYWDHDAKKASEPTNVDEMVRLVEDGVIGRHTLLAMAGDKEWTPAANFEEFHSFFPATQQDRTSDTPTPPGMHELTDATFDKNVIDGRTWLVAFYVPECGFCKRLAPEFKALSEEITLTNPRYAVARVNCEQNPVLTSRHSITGYPTIFALTTDKTRVDFNDHRNRVKSRFLSFLEEIETEDTTPQPEDEEDEL